MSSCYVKKEYRIISHASTYTATPRIVATTYIYLRFKCIVVGFKIKNKMSPNLFCLRVTYNRTYTYVLTTPLYTPTKYHIDIILFI